MAACQDKEEEEEWINFPLIVHIQSVNSQELAKQLVLSGASKKKEAQVTCLEGSSHFIFVGLSSGDVNVYFRAKLKLIFTIVGSQGGRICNILCSENENYVSIGSSHGKLSLYRCFNQILLNDGSENKTHNRDEPLFKLLYTLNHHAGNEITSMFWSPNERSLFIGDSCGLVSQLDVGSLEQFPRPIPSKSVLEATSRVMQMDYFFPYLAIATRHSVFLCDVESAEFVRVQVKKLRDIKATGLCFIWGAWTQNHPRYVNDEQQPCLKLLISEESTRNIYAANMEGLITETIRLTAHGNTTMYSAKLFSPIHDINNEEEAENAQENLALEEKVNMTIGNLLVTDTNYIVSHSHDYICIIEPKRKQIISILTSFNKIHKVKLVSNYLFVWYGKTLGLISLTQFRLYGEQLLKGGLVKVLERWIDHALLSIGYDFNTVPIERTAINNGRVYAEQNISPSNSNASFGNSTNEIAYKIFNSMLGPEIIGEDEFRAFVNNHIPTELVSTTTSLVPSKYAPNPYVLFIKNKLIPCFEDLENYSSESNPATSRSKSETIFQLMNCISEFYAEHNISMTSTGGDANTGASSSLINVLQKTSHILESINKLVVEERTTAISSKVNRSKELMTDFLEKNVLMADQLESNPLCSFFYSTAKSSKNALNWFAKFGKSEGDILQDAIKADIILYLVSFSSISQKPEVFIASSNKFMNFFTWILINVILNFQKSCPYTGLIRSTVLNNNNNAKIVGMISSNKFSKQLSSLIYRDFLKADITAISSVLHHLVSFAYLALGNLEDNQNQPLKTLLNSLPLQHWSNSDIAEKISQIHQCNSVVTTMLIEACLSHESSVQLCACGLPINYGGGNFISPRISSSQRSLDEALFKLMVKDDSNEMNEQPFELTQAFQFAMKRSAGRDMVLNPNSYTDMNVLTKILLRSGSCQLLQSVQFTENLLNLLLDERRVTSDEMPKQYCNDCNYQLKNLGEYKEISYDCIGVWILKNNNLENSIKLIKRVGLNRTGVFTHRFYSNSNAILKSRQNNSDFMTPCSCHHQQKSSHPQFQSSSILIPTKLAKMRPSSTRQTQLPEKIRSPSSSPKPVQRLESFC